MKKPDFVASAGVLRQELLHNGYEELPIQSAHAIAVARLPLLHRDPFDRLLVAQALVDGLTLVTVDRMLQSYSRSIEYVG